jgi:ribosomal protein RSM22 (predicted rRNA methylase)
MNKQEAIEAAKDWWLNDISYEDNERISMKYGSVLPFYRNEDILMVYLSEHPHIQIIETPTLFEKCENLWQNLNAVMIILESGTAITSEQIEHCKQVLITNKPSKQDEK